MRTVELRSDSSRYVLFLENPTKIYEQRLEGSVRQRVDAQVNKFLEEASPESAFQDAQKFPSPLRQLKDRGGKARALGTWCQGDAFDLFVVQILYDKDDENLFLPKKNTSLQSEGKTSKNGLQRCHTRRYKKKSRNGIREPTCYCFLTSESHLWELPRVDVLPDSPQRD